MDFTNLTNPAALLGLAALLAAGGALYLAALTLFTLFSLRHPRRRTYAYAVARNIPGEPAELDPPPPLTENGTDEWTLTNAGPPISIWDLRGDHPTGPTVIITHGWGSTRIDMLSRYQALRAHASRVILWDMPGHGDTTGPCTLGAHEPRRLAALCREVLGERAEDQLVLFGYSLGAEVTLKAADRLRDGATSGTRITGIILEAPYRHGITPANAVLDASRFPRLINLPLAMIAGSIINRTAPNERWHDLATRYAEPLATAHDGNPIPLLVIHGEHDTISPRDDGEAIAQAARGTLAEINGAGHKDLFEPNAPVRPQVAESLRSYFAALPIR